MTFRIKKSYLLSVVWGPFSNVNQFLSNFAYHFFFSFFKLTLSWSKYIILQLLAFRSSSIWKFQCESRSKDEMVNCKLELSSLFTSFTVNRFSNGHSYQLETPYWLGVRAILLHTTKCWPSLNSPLFEKNISNLINFSKGQLLSCT